MSNVPQKTHSKAKTSKKNVDIDKNSEEYKELYAKKYNIALKVVNKMLDNMGKEQIDDLLDFKMVNRRDIIKPENKLVIENMEKEIFEVFDKKNCKYYKRNEIQTYPITFLRCLLTDVGFKLISGYNEPYLKIDGLNARFKNTLYTIVTL